MATEKRPDQRGVSISTVSTREIVLVVLVMAVIAGAAMSFALLG